ncbi:MAG: hypothetical protein ABIN54_09115 [candidate division WOR-3 bacterium]
MTKTGGNIPSSGDTNFEFESFTSQPPQKSEPFKFRSFLTSPPSLPSAEAEEEEYHVIQTAHEIANSALPLTLEKMARYMALTDRSAETAPPDASNVYLPSYRIQIGEQPPQVYEGYLSRPVPPTPAEVELGLSGGSDISEVLKITDELTKAGNPPDPLVVSAAISVRMDRRKETLQGYLSGLQQYQRLIGVLAGAEPAGSDEIEPYPKLIVEGPWGNIKKLFTGELFTETGLETDEKDLAELYNWIKNGNLFKVITAMPTRAMVDLAHVGIGLYDLGASLYTGTLKAMAFGADMILGRAMEKMGLKPGTFTRAIHKYTDLPIFHVSTTLSREYYKTQLEEQEAILEIAYLDEAITPDEYRQAKEQLRALSSPTAIAQAVPAPGVAQNLWGLIAGIAGMYVDFVKNPVKYTLDHPGNVLLLAELTPKIAKIGAKNVAWIRDKAQQMKYKIYNKGKAGATAEATEIANAVKEAYERPASEGGKSLHEIISEVYEIGKKAEDTKIRLNRSIRQNLTPKYLSEHGITTELKPGEISDIEKLDVRLVEPLPTSIADITLARRLVEEPAKLKEFLEQFNKTHPEGIRIFRDTDGVLRPADLNSDVVVRVYQEILQSPDKIAQHGLVDIYPDLSGLPGFYGYRVKALLTGTKASEVMKSISGEYGEPTPDNPYVVGIVKGNDYHGAIQLLREKYRLEPLRASQIYGETFLKVHLGENLPLISEFVSPEFYGAVGELYSLPVVSKLISPGELVNLLYENSKANKIPNLSSPLQPLIRMLFEIEPRLDRFIERRSPKGTLYGEIEIAIPGSSKAIIDYLYNKSVKLDALRIRAEELKNTPENPEFEEVITEISAEKKEILRGLSDLVGKLKTRMEYSRLLEEVHLPSTIDWAIKDKIRGGQFAIFANPEMEIRLTGSTMIPLALKLKIKGWKGLEGILNKWQGVIRTDEPPGVKVNEEGQLLTPGLRDNIFYAMQYLKDMPGRIVEITTGNVKTLILRIRGTYRKYHIRKYDLVSWTREDKEYTGKVYEIDYDRDIAKVKPRGKNKLVEIPIEELTFKERKLLREEPEQVILEKMLAKLWEEIGEKYTPEQLIEGTPEEAGISIVSAEEIAGEREKTAGISEEPYDGYIIIGRFDNAGRPDITASVKAYLIDLADAERIYGSGILAKKVFVGVGDPLNWEDFQNKVNPGDALEWVDEAGNIAYLRVLEKTPLAIKVQEFKKVMSKKTGKVFWKTEEHYIRPGEPMLLQIRRHIPVPEEAWQGFEGFTDDIATNQQVWSDVVNKAKDILDKKDKAGTQYLGSYLAGIMTAMLLADELSDDDETMSEEDWRKAVNYDPAWWYKKILKFLSPGEGGWGEMGIKIATTALLAGGGLRLLRGVLIGQRPFETGIIPEQAPIHFIRQIDRIVQSPLGKLTPELWQRLTENASDFEAIERTIRAEGKEGDKIAWEKIKATGDPGGVKKLAETASKVKRIMNMLANYGNLIVACSDSKKEILSNMIYGEPVISPEGKITRSGGLIHILEYLQGIPQLTQMGETLAKAENRLTDMKVREAELNERIAQLEAKQATGQSLTPEEAQMLTSFQQEIGILREGIGETHKAITKFKRIVAEKNPAFINYGVLVELRNLRLLEDAMGYWTERESELVGRIQEASSSGPVGDIPRLMTELRDVRNMIKQIESKWDEVRKAYTGLLGTDPLATPQEIAEALVRQFQIPAEAETMLGAYIKRWVDIAKENGVVIEDVYEHYYPDFVDPKLASLRTIKAISEIRYGKNALVRLKGANPYQSLFQKPVKEYQIPFFELNQTVEEMVRWLDSLANAIAYDGLIKEIYKLNRDVNDVASVFTELKIMDLDASTFSKYLDNIARELRLQPRMVALITDQIIDNIYSRIFKKSSKFQRRRIEAKDLLAAFNNLSVNAVLGTMRTMAINILGSFLIATLRLPYSSFIKGAMSKLREVGLSPEETRRLIAERNLALLAAYREGTFNKLGDFNRIPMPVGLSSTNPVETYANIANRLAADTYMGLRGLFNSGRGKLLLNHIIQLGGNLYGFFEMLSRDILTKSVKMDARKAIESGRPWEEIRDKMGIDWARMVEGTETKYKWLYEEAQRETNPAIKATMLQHFTENLANDVLYQTQHLHPRGGNPLVPITRSGPIIGGLTAFWQFPIMFIGNITDALAFHNPKVSAKMLASYLGASYIACKTIQLFTGIDLLKQFALGEWFMPTQYNLSAQQPLSFGPWAVGGPTFTPMIDWTLWLIMAGLKKEADARQLASFVSYNMFQLPPGTGAFVIGDWKFDGRNLIFKQTNPRTGKEEIYFIPIGIPTQYAPLGQQANAIIKTITEWNRINDLVRKGQLPAYLAIPPAGYLSLMAGFGSSYYKGTPLGAIDALHPFYGTMGVDIATRRTMMKEFNPMVSLNPVDWKRAGTYQVLMSNYLMGIGIPPKEQVDIGLLRNLDWEFMAYAMIMGSPFAESRVKLPRYSGKAIPKTEEIGWTREQGKKAFKILMLNRAQVYMLENEGRRLTRREEEIIEDWVDLMFAEDPEAEMMRLMRERAVEQYTKQTPIPTYDRIDLLRKIWEYGTKTILEDIKIPKTPGAPIPRP